MGSTELPGYLILMDYACRVAFCYRQFITQNLHLFSQLNNVNVVVQNNIGLEQNASSYICFSVCLLILCLSNPLGLLFAIPAVCCSSIVSWHGTPIHSALKCNLYDVMFYRNIKTDMGLLPL